MRPTSVEDRIIGDLAVGAHLVERHVPLAVPAHVVVVDRQPRIVGEVDPVGVRIRERLVLLVARQQHGAHREGVVAGVVPGADAPGRDAPARHGQAHALPGVVRHGGAVVRVVRVPPRVGVADVVLGAVVEVQRVAVVLGDVDDHLLERDLGPALDRHLALGPLGSVPAVAVHAGLDEHGLVGLHGVGVEFGLHEDGHEARGAAVADRVGVAHAPVPLGHLAVGGPVDAKAGAGVAACAPVVGGLHGEEGVDEDVGHLGSVTLGQSDDPRPVVLVP